MDSVFLILCIFDLVKFLYSSVMLSWEKLSWGTLSLLVTLVQLQCKSMPFPLLKKRET